MANEHPPNQPSMIEADRRLALIQLILEARALAVELDALHFAIVNAAQDTVVNLDRAVESAKRIGTP